MAQNISGKVTDENGQALPGVSITEKGTNKGTVSQIDGTYKLVANATSTLVFSFVGYTTKEVIVGSQTKININLRKYVYFKIIFLQNLR
jgi:iron complex outermembrane receptor protein